MCGGIISWLMGIVFTVGFGLKITESYKQHKLSSRFYIDCFGLVLGVFIGFYFILPLIARFLFPDHDLVNFFPWCLELTNRSGY